MSTRLNISSFSCGYSRRFTPLSLPHELINGTGQMAGKEPEVKKSWSGALAILLVSLSAAAHARGMPGDPHAEAAPASAPATTAATVATPAPAWNNDSGATITRAQVYHELVQAQNDGELKTLNSTLYAHH
jgi:hypothetical protein